MTDEAITPAARRLLTECIESVAQLEILLRVMESAAAGAAPSEVAAALRLDQKATVSEMEQMARCGLLVRSGDEYRFAPADVAFASAARDVARAYAGRPVAVIGLIYAKPPGHIRAFSDAFRLRRDQPGKEENRG